MVGLSYRVQIRHILADKPELIELLKNTVEEIKGHTPRVQMMMRLAEKYSQCPTKSDGGNLGWLELGSNDPRIRDYDAVFENKELEQKVREAIRDHHLSKGKVYGPIQTEAGYHLIIIANEFGRDNATDFTGSAM
jgi:parvulin-like peptidyl-prolyl isomerase